MTKSIGKDVAGTGVLVNCIAPAVIETPILERLSQEHVDYMVERIPMGRDGRAGGGRRADLLARERGVLVLDRRHVRHLRRPGGRTECASSALRPARTAPRVGRIEGEAVAMLDHDDPLAALAERAARSPAAASSPSRTSCSRRSTRPRSGAPASRTSAAATRGVEEARPCRTSTRSSTTPTGRSSS